MKFVFNLFLLAAVLSLCKAADFDYRYQAKWYDIEDAECSLDRQSPIELSSVEALPGNYIPAIVFTNYNVRYIKPAELSNNGHTANIQLPKPIGYIESLWQIYDKLAPRISGGPLKSNSYIAESVHFHWGSRDAHGSEHVIDSKRYSMEMHIVHRNIKYQTVSDATSHEDGLAVLGVLFEVEPSLENGFPGLDKIINGLSAIEEYTQSTQIKNLLLTDLLGDIPTKQFYTYPGSLTTPPCSQAVTWIVFPQPIYISHDQMSQFRLLFDSHGEVLENNYRHLQAKGTRQVYLRN